MVGKAVTYISERDHSWTILVYDQWFSRRLKSKNLNRTDGAHHVMAKSKKVVYLAEQFFRTSLKYEEVKDVSRLVDATLRRS
jgi:hypothetical protein